MVSIHSNIQSVYATLRLADPKHKYEKLLHLCTSIIPRQDLALYVLARREGLYRRIAQIGSAASPIFVDIVAANERIPEFGIETTSGPLAGWLQVEATNQLVSDERDFLHLVCEVLAVEYEYDWVSRGLSEIVKPVSLLQNIDKYLSDLTEQVRIAADVPYCALMRNEDDETVRCMALKGPMLTSLPKPEDVVIQRDQQPALCQVLADVTTQNPKSCVVLRKADRDDVIEEARRAIGATPIQVIALTPLTVGEKGLGVLLLAIDFNVTISNLQKNAFMAYSNLVGAAWSNYEENGKFIGERLDDFREMRAQMNLELLHGMRHPVKNALADTGNKMTELKKNWAKVGTVELGFMIEDLEKSIDAAIDALVKMSVVGAPMETTFRTQRLKDVFESAKDLVQYQLSNASIQVVQGSASATTQAEVNGDSLRYAFLNLLMNSIEAFSRAPKRGRKISFQIDEHAERVTITLSDNATGLVMRGPLKEVNDIWKPGITTKEKGTGYGLPFVRMVVQDIHKGSIDVTEYRHGMTFKITLFKRRKF